MLQLSIFNILFILLWAFFIDGLLESKIADTLYRINTSLYYYLIDYKQFIFFICLLINTFFILYRFISHEINKKEEIYHAIDKILSDEDQDITLSESESRFSQKINDIKYQYLINKKNAAQAKQKKDDLIVYLAHDLKTPLTSVIGYLNLLNDEKENLSQKTVYKYINIALNKAKRVETLTNDFFEITRYDLHDIELMFSTIDLQLLMQQLIDECYPMFKTRNLHCNLHCPHPILFFGDGNQLARAFANILKNAINYSFENSYIDIYIQHIDSYIEIIFKNQCEPIPSYQLEKIFDKFYRLDPSRNSINGGSGLGLTITKDIVKLHHGSITAQYIDNTIEFIIRFPDIKDCNE